MPTHVFEIKLTHNGKTHDYMLVKNLAGLLELVQMGVIEIHPWGSRKDRIDRPDRIVFDLDPSPEVPFEAVKLAAEDVRVRLQELGLVSFLKTTGGKGIHVVIPIRRAYGWDEVKAFTRRFAEKMVSDVPGVYVSTMSKSKRTGRIFIDYFRNDYSATAIMNYSVRARTGAPVAVPLLWEELDGLQSSAGFQIADARARKREAGEILRLYRECRQGLNSRIMNML
jgi:bifunctional non-homologous end joining protein LigD